VERDDRAAAGQELGRLGQLPWKLLGPAVGADGAQSGHLHGTRALHHPGRVVHGLHDRGTRA
jgi:hypothetical protein